MSTTQPFAPSLLHYLKQLSSGVRLIPSSQTKEIPPSANGSTPEQDLQNILTYFSSPASSAQAPLDAKYLDLSKPLSWYFISTSHNTYLSGNQVYGAASGEAYQHVLRHGCRCVEIDVWDGEEKKFETGEHERLRDRIADHFHRRNASHGGESKEVLTEGAQHSDPNAPTQGRPEPRVLHGHTLTKEVPFRDVCIAIKDAAFKTSDLPLIVSLEVHAGAEQQAIMVEIMEECWKDMLVRTDTQSCKVLPSPESLKNKILVKVKGAPPRLGGISDELASEAARLKLEESEASESGSEEEKKLQQKSTNGSITTDAKKKKRSIISSLSALGKYTQAFHFKDLLSPEALIPTHVFSLSEKKLSIVHSTPGPTIFAHNKNFLMRAFPSGTRVNSSNLDPAALWRKGVQMVALNWQSCDAATMMNEAQFDGSDGWILKPDGYHGSLQGESKIGSESHIDAMPRKKIQISIELLAAQNLPMKKAQDKGGRLTPYVKCELHAEKSEEVGGMPTQQKEGGRLSEIENKRQSVTSKTADPDFACEMLRFREVEAVEELSFIRFKVMNDVLGKDPLLGWSCIRLDRLKEGYRLLHLLSADGEKSEAVMFVNIYKTVS